MASVISLSSTLTKGSQKKSDSPVSVLTISSELQRVPVSWEGKKKKKPNILEAEDTPNHCQKVKDWINTCNYEEANNSPEQKHICIRYDFDKSEKITINVPKSCFTRVTPLFSYMEKMKKSAVKIPEKVNGNVQTPLSPESQKKELCSYLQLMKPEEKKPNFFLYENRRSKRVKKLENNKNHQKVCSEDVNEYPTLKSCEDLKMSSIFKKKREVPNKYLPLPPKKVFSQVVDFEDSIKQIIDEVVKKKRKRPNGRFKKLKTRKKFKFALFTRLNLRSKGRLRHVSLDTIILRKRQQRKKARKKYLKQLKKVESPLSYTKASGSTKPASPHCDIISVHTNSDDENIDLKNFVDDMLELDKMSEEHRKSVIESRILASSSITNLINKKTQEADVQKAYKIFSDLSEKKTEEENLLEPEAESKNLVGSLVFVEHDYAGNPAEKEEDDESSTVQNDDCAGDSPENEEKDEESVRNEDCIDLPENEEEEEDEESVQNEDCACDLAENEEEEEDEESVQHEDCACDLPENEDGNSLSPVPIPNLEVLPVNTQIEVKTLHRSLTLPNRRRSLLNNYGPHNWNSGSSSDNKLNHLIKISMKDGDVLRAFYQDFNLVIVQENSVSFWTQSALGNVLGAQNMWIPKGKIQRIALNSSYVQTNANDMVISTETSVAYVELWTKEHKSEVREVPVADVFAMVYFWRLRQNGLEKKALQLENIKGYGDDVRYCVLRSYSRIIVCWYLVQANERRTKIHSYHLAADHQTVANISEIQPVQHYVSSLHNIEDCDSLVMGFGEDKLTLWNVEYGYIVATIVLSDIKSPVSTLWVKCDRGYLFTVQENENEDLLLIAINGMNQSWKKLQKFIPSTDFDRLKGVYIENGMLIACYSQGILCWNAQTGKLVKEVPIKCEYVPCGKNVILINNENVLVRHLLSHLISPS